MRAVQMIGALCSVENCRICHLLGGFLLSCYMDLSKFIHDFSKSLHEFVKTYKWI